MGKKRRVRWIVGAFFAAVMLVAAIVLLLDKKANQFVWDDIGFRDDLILELNCPTEAESECGASMISVSLTNLSSESFTAGEFVIHYSLIGQYLEQPSVPENTTIINYEYGRPVAHELRQSQSLTKTVDLNSLFPDRFIDAGYFPVRLIYDASAFNGMAETFKSDLRSDVGTVRGPAIFVKVKNGRIIGWRYAE